MGRQVTRRGLCQTRGGAGGLRGLMLGARPLNVFHVDWAMSPVTGRRTRQSLWVLLLISDCPFEKSSQWEHPCLCPGLDALL